MTAAVRFVDVHPAAQLLADARRPERQAPWLRDRVGGGIRPADAEVASRHVRYLPTGATLVKPALVEVERTRKPDWQPCRARCRACSRCIASLAYWLRGGRRYLGVDREAELAGAPNRTRPFTDATALGSSNSGRRSS